MLRHTKPLVRLSRVIAVGLEQIRQRCQQVDLAAVLGQATQPGFLKAELQLDHPEWVRTFRADVRLGRLDQIVQSSLRCVRSSPALAVSHRNPEPRCLASHLWSLGDALVASIAVHHLIIPMQQLSCWGQVVDIGWRDHD